VTHTFTKSNASRYSDALTVEAKGLELLATRIEEAGIQELDVPKTYQVSEKRLVMTAIHGECASPTHMARLGQGLAQLHQRSFPEAGLTYNNYIGLNPQSNGVDDNWGRFFVERRLEFQLSLIINASLRTDFQTRLSAVKPKLIHYLNHHCQQFSVLHGDLWSGNVLFDYDESGRERCWLIDPAVYYGDREVDLAMSELFGGFSPEFYRHYDDVFKRSSEYRNKRSIYNLYHYLNHYNLFGGSYLQSCEAGFEHIEQLL